jgi:hypothetical protein
MTYRCSFYVLFVSNLFLSNLHILLGFVNKAQAKNNLFDEIFQSELLCFTSRMKWAPFHLGMACPQGVH